MKKSVCYLRVSSRDQDHASQRHAMVKYFEAYGLSPEFYEEKGSGGSTDGRPLYNKLMSEIEQGLIDKVYVFKLDRFSRNVRDFLMAHEVMSRSGVSFISISDNLDFTTPMGRMMAQMLAVFAEFEREQIRTRVKSSYNARRAKGDKFGPSPRPFDTAKYLNLKKSGLTMSAIARQMGFSRSQLFARVSRLG